jgi:predicted small lipoprotein YifL/uncharacterized protein (DUF2141 family)
MKKILSLIFVTALAVSLLAACGSKEEPAATNETATEQTQEVVSEEMPATDEETTEEMVVETTEETPDAVTAASLTDDGAVLAAALGVDGFWLAAASADITYDKEIVVEGAFENRGEVARELALYASDADHNVTATYTLTAPKLTVKSENFAIAQGTFVGDVYIEAKGFNLEGDGKIDGNLYFASQELMDAAGEIGNVTGSVEVQ